MIRSGGSRGVLPDLQRASALIAERGMSIGAPLHLEAQATSTNDLAKDAARSGAPHGTTFVAEVQSAGRGRQGRTWTAARGEALLVSVLVRIPCPLDRLPLLSLASGLAARDAIARFVTREEPKVKWPNDVLVAGRKIAGVLVEGMIQGERAPAVIVGVGINVHTRDFAPEIATMATSVALHSDAPPDRAELLAELLAALDRDLAFVAARGLGLVHERLTRHDVLAGKRVECEGDEGTARGIDLDGRLVVARDDGSTAKWNAGEVHISSRRSSSAAT